MQTLQVDLNADVGESFGARRAGDDEPIFRYVTSGNVACGIHAGDPAIIAATIAAALARGVSVGAHPSYPDASGFGRTSVDLPPAELESIILYQLGAVGGVARGLGARLSHVKPHGALYNDAAKNAAIAAAVARAVAAYDRDLLLVGLAGSLSLQATRAAGLRPIAEAFCDRAYEADGSLRSRNQSGAVFEEPRAAARQAVEIVVRQRVLSGDGKSVPVHAQTLCIHGDSPHATEIAAAVRSALTDAGVQIVPMAQLA
jgi:UPF0271 protein